MKDPNALKRYLRTLTPADRLDFARRCGRSLTHIQYVAYGAKGISAETAIAIERESGGAVRAEDLRSDLSWDVIRGRPCRCGDRPTP